jgi:hypothetical protein
MLLLHHNPDLKWSPWSDSHRRLRVYKTRPVAAEAQGREEKYEGRRMKDELNQVPRASDSIAFILLTSYFLLSKLALSHGFAP